MLSFTDCFVSHTAVENVGTACFTFINTSHVVMSSVKMTDGDQGVKAVQDSASQLHFRDVHISRMSTGIYLSMEAGASVKMNIDESTVAECSYGFQSYQKNSGQESSLRLVIAKSVFRENTNYALYMPSSGQQVSVLISACLVEGSSRYHNGFYVDLRNANFSVMNNTFRSLTQPMDLRIYGEFQKINIEHNHIENTFSRRDIYLRIHGSGNIENSTLDIVDNVIRQGNGDTLQRGGIRVEARYQDFKRVNIDRNVLSGINNLALYLYLYYISPLVSISENIISDCEEAIRLDPHGRLETARIHQNTVLRNFGTEIIRLPTGSEFKRNTMRNNSNTVVSVEASNILLQYNVFDNPDAAFNIKVSTSLAGNANVNASLNYWGTVDSRQIVGKFYDQKSDPDLPLIIFQPYFENSSLSSIYEETLVFVTPDGTIGGDVNGNVTLTVEGSPYTAVGSIYIRAGDILRIEAGVDINFLPNTAVIVEGIGVFLKGRLSKTIYSVFQYRATCLEFVVSSPSVMFQ